MPHCQTNLVIALHALSLFFSHFVNTTAYHLSRYELHLPKAATLHGWPNTNALHWACAMTNIAPKFDYKGRKRKRGSNPDLQDGRHRAMKAVWPDWAIFEASWWQNLSWTKVAQMYGDFLAYLKNITFQVKTAVDTFWATFRKFGQLFISTSGHTVCRRLWQV